ncbi:MAG: alpha/beta hydrolase [Acidobacteria bacterium]|nr:MAG: alpha/beta hydrolase [Acidobacteriota bacterium]
MAGTDVDCGALAAEPTTERSPSFVRAAVREQARIVRIRPRAPLALVLRVTRWWAATVLRESGPHLIAAGIAALAALRVLGVRGRVSAMLRGLAVIGTAWEARNAWLAHRSTIRIDAALEGLEPEAGVPRVPRAHLAIPPLMFVTREVRRERGLVFAEVDGTRLRLDVYRSAAASAGGGPRPAVIQVHGGGWFAGSRYEQGIPLLNHLAQIGWTGFNIDYRLSPEATFPDQIVDVKRAIAWVRSNAGRLGIDPGMICITGGSAGGHLTALAGLTENAPEYQPGFEGADTSLAAAVPFYGVYDFTNAGGFYYAGMRDWVLEQVVFKRRYADAPGLFRAASPSFRVHAGAPPFLVIHGERDTLVPVADARDFVARLRAVSRQPVRYIELPAAEHAFDLWPSERTARVAEGIGRFLQAVARGGGSQPPGTTRPQPGPLAEAPE